MGGSSALGTWGYLQASEELRQQTSGMGISDVVMVGVVGVVGVWVRVGVWWRVELHSDRLTHAWVVHVKELQRIF